jgi:hypothetical protein
VISRRTLLALAAAAVAGCRSDGELNIFGYSSGGLFDPNVRTVYVPVFKNVALLTTPNRELEVDITLAVIRELRTRSRIRVVSDRETADTELLGTLVNVNKNVLNRNQQNLPRETEITLGVQIVWTDLRDGRILSNPISPRPNVEAPPEPFDPSAPPLPPGRVREKPYPVLVQAPGRLLVELGETNATANKMAVDQLAKQIVNMMEAGW